MIDTTKGTVHMVIGGGGSSVPSNELFFDPPQCRVIVSVGSSPDPATGKRPPVYVKEDAPWSAVRNAAHAYGFAAFTVDPGSERGGAYHHEGRLLRCRGTRWSTCGVRNVHTTAASPRPGYVGNGSLGITRQGAL